MCAGKHGKTRVLHDTFVSWNERLRTRRLPGERCAWLRADIYYDKKENVTMSSTAIVTVTKMMESLPEPAQDQVVEHLREYLEDLQDGLQWDALFKRTQAQLVAAARRARQEIAQGLAKPMDYDQL
jgi:hypothetical protein